MPEQNPFKGRHFEAEMILWILRWYLLFPISYRELELMLADQGVAVDHHPLPPDPGLCSGDGEAAAAASAPTTNLIRPAEASRGSYGGVAMVVRDRRRPSISECLAIILGCLLIMSGPSSADNLSNPAPIRLTAQDDGRSVELSVGDLLEIAIEENPTTGYMWQVESIDPAILQEIGKDYVSDRGPVGSGSIAVLHFKAVGAGRTLLRLINRRPFESDREPIGTFTATAIVSNKGG